MNLSPQPAMALAPSLTPQPVHILHRHDELPGTVTLQLAASTAVGQGGFQPGQFNMLYVFGVGEVPISCSGDPAAGGGLVHTVRAVGTVTRALCALPAGATVGVRGPFGSAWPLAEAAGFDVVLIAGGLGIAPLRPVIHHVLRHRGAYGRVAVIYGSRSPEDLLYQGDRVAWSSRTDLALAVTVDHAGPGWSGPVGVAPALLAGLGLTPGRTIAMLCGPEVMMRFTIRELERLGIGAEHIYVSLERNMKCATGFCGHCQFGPVFVCKDGPVFRFDRVAPLFYIREV